MSMEDHGEMTKLLKIPECAERLGVSRSLCYEMARSGEIPIVRLSERAIRVPEDALDAWIKDQTVQANGH
jgi:excisionase family DNA binding protein